MRTLFLRALLDPGVKVEDLPAVLAARRGKRRHRKYLDTIRPIISACLNELDVEVKRAIWLQTDPGIDWAINEVQEDTPEHEIPLPDDTDDIAEYILADYVLPSAGNWSNARIERYKWEQDELEHTRPRSELESPQKPLPESPGSPLSPSPLQFRGLPDPVDPRLLLIANPDGSLKPEFQDWENQLPLEPGSLLPLWWPGEADGEVLSPEERLDFFRQNLDAVLSLHAPPTQSSSATSPASAPVLPAATISLPQAVLTSLLQLRSAVLQE